MIAVLIGGAVSVPVAVDTAGRAFTLAEGSKEIMKTIVARELLGKDFISYK